MNRLLPPGPSRTLTSLLQCTCRLSPKTGACLLTQRPLPQLEPPDGSSPFRAPLWPEKRATRRRYAGTRTERAWNGLLGIRNAFGRSLCPFLHHSPQPSSQACGLSVLCHQAPTRPHSRPGPRSPAFNLYPCWAGHRPAGLAISVSVQPECGSGRLSPEVVPAWQGDVLQPVLPV